MYFTQLTLCLLRFHVHRRQLRERDDLTAAAASGLWPQRDGGSAADMLKRKATRIELKPEDREEYFAHKQQTAKQSEKQPDPNHEKLNDKHVRIGLVKPR